MDSREVTYHCLPTRDAHKQKIILAFEVKITDIKGYF